MDGVEEWLGLRLPTDYKRLASAHGPVLFGEYIWIHVPCFQDGDIERGQQDFDYGSWLHDTHRWARIMARDELPESDRPVFHPTVGGLLAWGFGRHSDILFWDTSASSDPDEWPVVVCHGWEVIHKSPSHPEAERHTEWREYGLGFTEYLKYLTDDEQTPDPFFGRLPPTISRTRFLVSPRPWEPPEDTGPRLTDAERRVALETGSGLKALRLLCPPPRAPHLGGSSWEELFTELGTRLPAEYMELMETYGSGCWTRWLRFHTPLRTGENGFTDHVREINDGYRYLRDEFPEGFPLPVWPEPGGFLPFATSLDEDEVGWLANSTNPDEWPLIVHPRHDDQGPPLERGLIATLLEWQRGKFGTEGLPRFDEDDDPVEFAEFHPWGQDSYW
ncbi:hypothetical protein SAMN04487904_107166 [Actinopolyspora lacussalsi subsp. righensis]|uniref:SMI1 / KNR4 family (SUKH-1) n=1 Tax=Actinopolyspora righensis TaxID=995060 RepID=A0A1I7AKN9_9ACTN|nr:hypothetical protein SAMN04487904_107166 [Actinopolyspora righensis]